MKRAARGTGVVCWCELDRRRYRAALRAGEVSPGVALEAALDPRLGTVVFVHGLGGAPARFAEHARSLRGMVNLGAFLYDDRARLAPSAEALRAALSRLPGRVLLVAHSVGALLAARVGVADVEGRFAGLRALFLNPLVGGSRHADADPALVLLGSLPMLRWLHGVKRGLQRAFLPAAIQDLTPECDFQQAIFGARSRRSSFADGTSILFTEKPGGELDVREPRVRQLFGRSRDELIERLGSVVPVAAADRTGHTAPLTRPDLVVRAAAAALGDLRSPRRLAGSAA